MECALKLIVDWLNALQLFGQFEVILRWQHAKRGTVNKISLHVGTADRFYMVFKIFLFMDIHS